MILEVFFNGNLVIGNCYVGFDNLFFIEIEFKSKCVVWSFD